MAAWGSFIYLEHMTGVETRRWSGRRGRWRISKKNNRPVVLSKVSVRDTSLC